MPNQQVEVLTPSQLVGADPVANGHAMQQVRGTYTTAMMVQRPRDLNKIIDSILMEADHAGDTFFYGWGAGKDKIEGASVQLAVSMARCYGNCAVESLPLQETGDSWIFTSAFVDLETGFTLARQFRQSKKSKVHGKIGREDPERADDIRFQIGQSKSHRNAILSSMPGWLVDKVIARAKEGVRLEIEGLVKKASLPVVVDRMVKALAQRGVKEAAILHRFGIADRKAIDIDAMVLLRGSLKQIDEGQETAATLFPMPETEADKAASAPGAGDVSADDLMNGGQPATATAAAPPSSPAAAAPTASASQTGSPPAASEAKPNGAGPAAAAGPSTQPEQTLGEKLRVDKDHDFPGNASLTGGTSSKGGQNPPEPSTPRPAAPQGSAEFDLDAIGKQIAACEMLNDVKRIQFKWNRPEVDALCKEQSDFIRRNRGSAE